MEMHQLRYLDAVARTGSMLSASLACHVSQPALSVQIRKLEEEIGQPLLHRNSRGATLTPAGERTLASARRILGEVARLQREARDKSFRAPETLCLAVQPYLATEYIAPLLRRSAVMNRWPAIEIIERLGSRLHERVLRGEVDFGIVDLASTPASDFSQRPIAQESYGLCCSREHPLAQRREVRLQHLLEYPLALYETCPHLRARLAAEARQRHRPLRIPFSTEMAQTAFEFAAEGDLITVIPASFHARARRRKLILRPLADFSPEVRIGAIWSPERPLSATAEHFLSFLCQAAPQVVTTTT